MFVNILIILGTLLVGFLFLWLYYVDVVYPKEAARRAAEQWRIDYMNLTASGGQSGPKEEVDWLRDGF